jgi:hypothetical protein
VSVALRGPGTEDLIVVNAWANGSQATVLCPAGTKAVAGSGGPDYYAWRVHKSVMYVDPSNPTSRAGRCPPIATHRSGPKRRRSAAEGVKTIEVVSP